MAFALSPRVFAGKERWNAPGPKISRHGAVAASEEEGDTRGPPERAISFPAAKDLVESAIRTRPALSLAKGKRIDEGNGEHLRDVVHRQPLVALPLEG